MAGLLALYASEEVKTKLLSTQGLPVTVMFAVGLLFTDTRRLNVSVQPLLDVVCSKTV